jgi:hypothetical protein
MGAIATAAANDDTEGMLVAMRDRLAKALDDGVPARELASVSKRLVEIHKDLEALRAAKQQAADEKSDAGMHEVVTQLLGVVSVLAPLVAGGALVPFVVSLITQSHWSAKVRQVLMIAVSAIVATILYLNDNGWYFTSAADVLAAVIAVVTAAQTTYHGLWKKSGLTDAVSKLTDRTTATEEDILHPAVIPAGVTPMLPEANGGVDADMLVDAAPRHAADPEPEGQVTAAQVKRLPDGPFFG